jgi:hypothetical protein
MRERIGEPIPMKMMNLDANGAGRRRMARNRHAERRVAEGREVCLLDAVGGKKCMTLCKVWRLRLKV